MIDVSIHLTTLNVDLSAVERESTAHAAVASTLLPRASCRDIHYSLICSAALLGEFSLSKFQRQSGQHGKWLEEVENCEPAFSSAELAAFCQQKLGFDAADAALVEQSRVNVQKFFACTSAQDIIERRVPGLELRFAKPLFNAFHVIPSAGLAIH